MNIISLFQNKLVRYINYFYFWKYVRANSKQQTLSFKLCFVLVALFTSTFIYAQTGDWDNSSAKTSTAFDVGIGTILPEGKTEIQYCTPAKNGLVITQSNCGTSSSGGPIILWPEGSGGVPISQKVDLKLLITPSLTSRPLLWGRVEGNGLTTTSTSKYNTKMVLMPNGYLGLNIDNPRCELDVINTNGDKGLNQPVAIFGVLNTPNINQDQHTRHIQIVPNLTRDAFNRSSEQGDLGIFYTDGLKSEGLNENAGLVIAPWNASSTNVGFLGMRITNEGAVGIGTRLDQNPYNYKLAVNGTIGAKEVNVEEFSSTWWPDYVFDQGYNLISIIELESFIKQNKHLPEIPSASEIAQTGVNLADMNARLLRKVEELSLYIIDLNNRLDKLEANEK